MTAEVRQHHQQVVAALLDEIEERRRRRYAAQAAGIRPAALRELEAEEQTLRRELAAALDLA
jgi:hypothetical protein